MSGMHGVELPGPIARRLGMPAADAVYGALRSPTPLFWISLLLAWCWLLPNTQQIFARRSVVLDESVPTPRLRWLEFGYTARWAMLTAAVALTCFLYVQSNLAQEFLYFDF